jgi:hypothetical protein
MPNLTDVPFGHIFRFLWCDCIYRRVNASYADRVQTCEEHRGRQLPVQRVYGASMEGLPVRYDPLAAQLEAESKE